MNHDKDLSKKGSRVLCRLPLPSCSNTVHRCRPGIRLVFALIMLAAMVDAAPRALAAEFRSSAPQAMLMEAQTGATLYQKAADERIAPASMSKLMTLEIVFRALKSGHLKLTDEFIMSEHAWRTGGAPSRTSAMMVPVNTREPLDQLIQGIIVQSGNDAAIAVAEGIAGSERAFAELMNKEAKRIGLEHSTFANPTGLDHPDQLMTAHDLAILARYLIAEFPEYYKMFAQKEFHYRRHKFYNRNRLLFRDIGVDGLKTGHLARSGYGVVVSAKRDGRRLIAVVAGLETQDDRWREATRLVEWGFSGFRKFKLFNDGEVVGQARVWGGTQWYVPVAGHGDVRVLLPRYPASQKLTAHVVYDGPLKPPIRRGDQVATLEVVSTSGVSNQVPLFATEDVPPASKWRQGLDSLFHLAFGWLP
jgi:serine-type D-Ala-D-Ala carboxypeptidase (penicillin-binding protein 5/6)